ncbi:MAG: FtsW/RodA/SpoVE family cell cycle protein [Planctomycetota bacterium]
MDPAHRLRLALFIIVGSLCGFGLVMIASTTIIGTGRGDGSMTYSFLLKQIFAMGVGIGGAILISRLGVGRLADKRIVILAVAVAIIALLGVLTIGREINGARRWIDLGPINLQPAEIAKLVVVIAVAWILGHSAERIRTFRFGLLFPVLAFAVLGGLVYATRDLGSVVVMGVVLVAMMMMAGARWLELCGIGLAVLPMLAYYAVWSVSYRRARFFAFLDPWNSDGPAGYHLQQSFVAIGSGGVSGLGLGEGGAKLSFLPERHTDFIFAVICEEFGMIGGLGVAAMFMALVVVGLMIAQQSRDLHRRLLATGAVVLLGTQAFWNMLVVTGAAPTKGLTLPFISYGGSSIVICLVLIGVLDACARANALELRHAPLSRRSIGAHSTRLKSTRGVTTIAPVSRPVTATMLRRASEVT